MTQKELGYVELEWTCPACNTRNAGSARKCRQCGTSQPEEVKFEQAPEEKLITDAAKLQEAAAGPDIYCAYCGTRNASTAKVCKQCGADLGEGKARQAGTVLGGLRAMPALPVKCPACGVDNPATAHTCAKCGAPLGKTAPPQPSAPPRGCNPIVWIAIGAVVLIAAVILISLGSRTSALVGVVSDVQWRRTIAIEALMPVSRAGWRSELPAGTQVGACRQEVYKTQDSPAPGAREVCGTPYVEDTGSGFGKVVQDCQYQIFADWCEYQELAWVAVPALLAEGHDLAPRWPAQNLAASQRIAGQTEGYSVIFDTDGRALQYAPRNEAEFRSFRPGSRWQLEVNGFGSITGVSPK